MRNRVWLILVAAATLSGCKALVPYHSKFMCEKTNDYGKCQDVQHAYEEAVAGSPKADPGKQKDDRTWRYRTATPKAFDGKLRRLESKARPGVIPASLNSEVPSEDIYRDRKYRELAALIEQPVTPIVRPPQVIRTLIVGYRANNALYEGRRIYYFAREAEFVLAEPTQDAGDPRTLYPNGMPSAQKR